jgi:hypothetical protein
MGVTLGRLRSRWRLFAALAVIFVSIPVFLAWEAGRAVRQARERVSSASGFPLTIRALDRPLPARVGTVGAPAVFRDAAVFRGHLVVSGPQGLVEYDANGGLQRRFRTGLELPPAGIAVLVVGSLTTTSEPELLIATSGEGLLLFDGRGFTQVRAEAAQLRKLTAVLALASGRALLGTDGAGLFAFDGRTLSLAHPKLANVAIATLAGTDGDIWIGTRDRGVWHWRAGGVDRFDERNGLPDPRVLSLATHGGRAYVGTALGVAEFDNGHYTRTLGSGLFAAALTIRQDTLIVGTIDRTLAELPLDIRPSRGERPLAHDVPATIERFIDTDGALYALADDALYAVDSRTTDLRRVIGADAGQLTDRNVSALALDAANRLWVGYFDRGLDILDANGDSGFNRTTHVEDDHVFCINRIVTDPHGGQTAVATANGLVLFDAAGRPRQVLGRAQGLIADHVTDLVINAGHMTIATPAGLTFLDPDGGRSISAFHGLVNNHVYALGTSGSQVFAGTLGGASLLDNGVIQASYTTSNSSLSHNWISAVIRLDDTWIVGTYGGGLFRLDTKGHWERFTDAPPTLTINPNAMLATATNVFAGTLSNGLMVYSRESRRWTSVEAGLPSLNVTALAADATGGLYVGTDNGIVRLTAPGDLRP